MEADFAMLYAMMDMAATAFELWYGEDVAGAETVITPDAGTPDEWVRCEHVKVCEDGATSAATCCVCSQCMNDDAPCYACTGCGHTAMHATCWHAPVACTHCGVMCVQ